MELQDLINSLKKNNPIELQSTLDGLVHDIHDENASNSNPFDPDEQSSDYEAYEQEASIQASNLNNQGIDAQLSFIAMSGCSGRALNALSDLHPSELAG